MTASNHLLSEYIENGSETAFRELVTSYVDLVHSTAFRLVNNNAHLAEDITQTVFVDLARMARNLPDNVMLGGWLHRHTCFVAQKTMRGERRRQERERQAMELNSTEDHSAANLAQVAPVLDEAIDQLGTEDRTAILLRFFEQRDFASVGQALGSNEDAARKRVNRALEKLHSLLTRRGVALSAAALTATLSTQAVTAAPAGLALSISTVALAGAATGTGTALTFLKIMSMTKTQMGIAAALVAAVAIPLAMEHRDNIKLREENATLRKQTAHSSELAADNERLSTLLAEAKNSSTPTNEQFHEVLKLRGEVGRLRTAATAPKTNGPSAFSGVSASPEMLKVIREQQKASMQMIYQEFAKRLKLDAAKKEKLGDLLADNVMENIEQITGVLRDGKTAEEMKDVFAGQDAALLEKVQELLGPEGLKEYQDYTRNLASHLTAEQFKAMLTGDKAAKDQKSKQLYQLMQEEREQALVNAGLGPDYQVIPMLNFRNIASEQDADRSLTLMDSIYARVIERANTFLNAEELKKLEEFRASAINGNRAALLMNRKLMSPAPK